MARFRDMRKFVRLLEEVNEERVKDRNVALDDQYYPFLANKEIIINAFVSKGYANKSKAQRIYADTTSKHYAYIREKEVGNKRVSDVTSRGRHFLMKLGPLREFARDNEKWLNPSVTFIVGVLAAGIPFVIYLLSKRN